MTEPPPTPQDRRNRLIGRLIIIGFGLLLLIYLVPLALNFVR